MGKRRKLKLAYISNDSIRRTTLRRRGDGLKKKLSEIKTLCGVDACAVIYDPEKPTPDVWPSEPEVSDVIKRVDTETATKRIMMNQKDFLNQCIEKAKKQERRMVEDNKEIRLKEAMFKCLEGGKMGDPDMNNKDRRELCEFVNKYLKNLYYHRDVTLKNPDFEIGESSSRHMVPSYVPVMAPPPPMAETNQGAADIDLQISNNQEVYIPAVNQDEFHYPNQNHDGTQDQGFIEQMMKYGEETNFPWMDHKQF
ncbi:agamous-like MADS-box protein AGL80 isoform X2 [Capsella rubella]|nr:agamous-like MADS-box protein AGL80 isoform X2 [Capsella rubella]